MRRRSERGSAAIELVGMVPILVLVTILCVEAFMLAASYAAAEKAARDGARAASLGRDGHRAAAASLPGWARASQISEFPCDGICYRVRVRVPLIVHGLTNDRVTVTRTASMPDPTAAGG
jgi:Flp pilus assembly protein TadG